MSQKEIVQKTKKDLDLERKKNIETKQQLAKVTSEMIRIK